MGDMMIGDSRAMQEVRNKIEIAARCDLPVLIEGETGTGKELVAHRIHALSPRSDHRLVTVDCATIPENLMESELFGHAKGAFTGAVDNYAGRIQEAAAGSLFFDEIGDIPTSVQSKLLRFLDTGEFPRVREPGMRHVDTRVITATSRLLHDGVREGRVRPDFYYRLSAMYIWVPPLRERREDIPALAHYVLRAAGQTNGIVVVEERALRTLMEHDWPGNVRELKNTLLANLTANEGGRIAELTLLPTTGRESVPSGGDSDAARSLRGYLEDKEREYLAQLATRGEIRLAVLADAADISVRTLQRKFKYHNLRY